MDIDIPVDDGPLVGQSRRSAPPPEKKKSFFDRKPRVPSPDQLLVGHLGRGQTQSDVHPEPEHTQPADMEPMDEPIPVTPEELTLEPEGEPAFLSQPIYAPQDPAPAPQPEPEPVFAPVNQPAPAAAAAPPRPLSVQPSPHVPEPSAPLPVPEEPETVSKGEVAQQAAQVAQDIQGNMGQTIPPYQYPPLSLLTEGPAEMGGQAMAELNANRQRLTDTIHSFGIDANIVNVTRGPSVTRYELELDQGVRLNKLTNLADDIALALGATGVRIAPIPDQISMVGIEVPNKAVTAGEHPHRSSAPRPSPTAPPRSPSPWARTSAATPSWATSPSCPTCSSPVPPAPASPCVPTPSSPPCCTRPRRTRCV